MSQPSRQRSNSSVDQLFKAVGELDDEDICALLEEFNNTVESNVQVSRGIGLFERPGAKLAPFRLPSVRRSAPQPLKLSTPPKSTTALSSPTSSTSKQPNNNILTPEKPLRNHNSATIPSPIVFRAPCSPAPSTLSGFSTASSEPDDANLDSLERLVFGRGQRDRSEMNDIFEVLNL